MSEVGYYYTESSDIELIVTKGREHRYPWHIHTRHWIVGVVRHGAVLLATRTNIRRLNTGQHFFIRPYEPHSLAVEPESSLLTLCLDESGAFLTDGDSVSSRLSSILQANEKALFAEAVAACEKTMLSHEYCEYHPEAYDSLIVSSIREIMRLVMEKPDETLPIARMAAYAGYSQWHFLRAFRRITGMTPHAFQLVCRMRLLRSMLRSDTARATAAVSAGFADQSHMHKVFKLHHGMTPGEFKKASIKLEL